MSAVTKKSGLANATLNAANRAIERARRLVGDCPPIFKAKFIPAEKESDKAPDFRTLAGAVEFGAAWKTTAQNGREYLSFRLDDPIFAAPIFANLIEDEEATHQLIWSHRSAD